MPRNSTLDGNNLPRTGRVLAKTLVDKAFPDIEEATRERMAVDRFLSQIVDPQLAFSVRQKQPKNLDEVVMEMQSHLSLSFRGSSGVALAEASVVAVDRRQQDTKVLDTLHQLVTRMEKLQTDLSTSRSQGLAPRLQPPTIKSQTEDEQPKRVLYRCGEEGHYARNCPAPRPRFIQRNQGNWQPPAPLAKRAGVTQLIRPLILTLYFHSFPPQLTTSEVKFWRPAHLFSWTPGLL